MTTRRTCWRSMKGVVVATRPSQREAFPKLAWQVVTLSSRLQSLTRSNQLSVLRAVPRLTAALLNLGVTASECLLQQKALYFADVAQLCLRCADSCSAIRANFARGGCRERLWPRVVLAGVLSRHDQVRLCSKWASRPRPSDYGTPVATAPQPPRRPVTLPAPPSSPFRQHIWPASTSPAARQLLTQRPIRSVLLRGPPHSPPTTSPHAARHPSKHLAEPDRAHHRTAINQQRISKATVTLIARHAPPSGNATQTLPVHRAPSQAPRQGPRPTAQPKCRSLRVACCGSQDKNTDKKTDTCT